MKIEISDVKPENFVERWPGEFNIFSHFEMALGIPHTLFLITTLKENGKPNACFQSWSSFTGDCGGYFAVTPVMQHTHTYRNILRDREFCINFISERYFGACYETIFNNADEVDEIAAGGFTAEAAVQVRAPRIKEAFMSLECRLQSESDLSGQGINSLLIGRVLCAAVEEEYLNGADKKYGQDGFMYYLYDLYNYKNGDQGERKIASLNVLRKA
jgi:flavin reductase (DIM6/NTAB) family NADH-FMN oxidoreductase RutF